jgi:hypothetical protein
MMLLLRGRKSESRAAGESYRLSLAGLAADSESDPGLEVARLGQCPGQSRWAASLSGRGEATSS